MRRHGADNGDSWTGGSVDKDRAASPKALAGIACGKEKAALLRR